MGIAEQLRQAVKDSGRTQYSIAKASGVDVASLWRFVEGSDLYLSTAARLADAMGLELKPKKER